ncbi:hypothetical protein Pcac1_g14106 [Phytophthora cactorum]|uniref:Uncharacterized protein n=1 Tax=Phytophthora cactorum TaxID=29920 RepID=A0A8T1CA97_9STRA|nr:hypothetical protein Pcac1_g14106 [Phytophthora cactorum]KAG2824371.1 hypothetical protein PC111_g9861 [Phytophthora cactorum]KAG2918647.1 hypothetical protein PC115_g10382 [Phytophthora cactorum]KAG3062544.1 hypothetical protein PC121_g12546 [Phytophthora cactorum]
MTCPIARLVALSSTPTASPRRMVVCEGDHEQNGEQEQEEGVYEQVGEARVAWRHDRVPRRDQLQYVSIAQRGYSRVGERATVALTPSQGSNLHVLGGVSSGTGTMLMRTHAGSVKKQEHARFVADLFTAALGTEEYCELAHCRSR